MGETDYDPAASNPGWRAEVESWPWHELDADSSRKIGSCPRCEHQMTVDAGAGTAVGLLPLGAPRPVLARCNCGGLHDGHPARPLGDWGCGFRVMISPP